MAKYVAATASEDFKIEDDKPYSEVRLLSSGGYDVQSLTSLLYNSYGWERIHHFRRKTSKQAGRC